MITSFLLFAWDYLLNCLEAILLGIGLLGVTLLVVLWRRVAREARASRYEAGRDYRPSVTTLHGSRCRCFLCCIEGKGKGGRKR